MAKKFLPVNVQLFFNCWILKIDTQECSHDKIGQLSTGHSINEARAHKYIMKQEFYGTFTHFYFTGVFSLLIHIYMTSNALSSRMNK